MKKVYQRKLFRSLLLFCLHQLMTVPGQTCTRSHIAVLTQERN
jgi:hypothetical protein